LVWMVGGKATAVCVGENEEAGESTGELCVGMNEEVGQNP